MKFYSPTKLGKKQSLTPEGFLLCSDVPIARTGQMLYGEDETPIEVGMDGLARIERTSEEVFRPETIASFEGKPVTLNHPEDGVDPDNWGKLAKGVLRNVRKGEGLDSDYLLSDVLITDREAITAVRDGEFREVSCGYDADYIQTGPGRGRQHNIIGNHLALVKQGRCGNRCAIGDWSNPMAKEKKSWKDKVMEAFTSKDQKALESALESAEEGNSEGGTNIHIHTNKTGDEKKDEEGTEKKTADALQKVMDRLDALDAKVTKMAKDEYEEEDDMTEDEDGDEDEDDKKKFKDAATLKAQFKDTAARAEILAPGFKMPTFDSKTFDAKKTQDTICACKRKALDIAYRTSDEDKKEALTPFVAGVDLKKATCSTVDALFLGASEVIKAKNNDEYTQKRSKTDDSQKQVTPAELNKRNSAFWNDRHAKN